MVVTDWFNLSLYRIAKRKWFNEGAEVAHVCQRTGLPGGIETQHEQPHLLVPKQPSCDSKQPVDQSRALATRVEQRRVLTQSLREISTHIVVCG